MKARSQVKCKAMLRSCKRGDQKMLPKTPRKMELTYFSLGLQVQPKTLDSIEQMKDSK